MSAPDIKATATQRDRPDARVLCGPRHVLYWRSMMRVPPHTSQRDVDAVGSASSTPRPHITQQTRKANVRGYSACGEALSRTCQPPRGADREQRGHRRAAADLTPPHSGHSRSVAAAAVDSRAASSGCASTRRASAGPLSGEVPGALTEMRRDRPPRARGPAPPSPMMTCSRGGRRTTFVRHRERRSTGTRSHSPSSGRKGVAAETEIASTCVGPPALPRAHRCSAGLPAA